MATQLDDKSKVTLLVVALILVVVMLGFRVMSFMKSHQISNNVSTVTTMPPANAIPAPAEVTGGSESDPFWRPYSIALIENPGKKQAASRAAVKTMANGGNVAVIMPPAPIVMQNIELLGILDDDNGSAMAVVRSGDSTRYLRCGAQIDPATTITQISEGRIVVSERGVQKSIAMGKALVRTQQTSGAADAPKPTTLEGFSEPAWLNNLPPGLTKGPRAVVH